LNFIPLGKGQKTNHSVLSFLILHLFISL